VRRVEIINGIGGRRRWSVDDKARIVKETLVPERWCRRSPGVTG
jgi:transposase